MEKLEKSSYNQVKMAKVLRVLRVLPIFYEDGIGVYRGVSGNTIYTLNTCFFPLETEVLK